MKVTDLVPGDVLLVKSDHYKPAGLTIERVKVVRKMSGTLQEWVAETEAISTVDGSMSEPYVMDYMFTMNSLMIERVPAPVFDKAMHLRELYLAGLRGLVSGAKLIEGAAKDGCDDNNEGHETETE